MKIRIGTRGSKLALWQANYIRSLLGKISSALETEVIIIKTTGDAIQNVSLTQMGGKGLFVKEIESALLSGDIDIAVHSMKDMPAQIPVGLSIAATPAAEEPWDVMVFNRKTTLTDLKAGAVIGTTSLRRIVQLRRTKPGLRFEMLRGNIDTRIRKLEAGSYDAIVIAYAGMNRLGIRPAFVERLDIIPSAGQGIIAVESHENSAALRSVLVGLNHGPTFSRAAAERGFVTRLGADCQVPAGAHAAVTGNSIEITGFVADPQGSAFFQDRVIGSTASAYGTGVQLAERLLKAGASEIVGMQA